MNASKTKHKRLYDKDKYAQKLLNFLIKRNKEIKTLKDNLTEKEKELSQKDTQINKFKI